MYRYGDKIIADAGYCLVLGEQSLFSVSVENSDKVTEKELPENYVIAPHDTCIFGGAFSCKISKTIKAELIKQVYSNDDQIAIILNKDNSEEDMLAFNRMQDWRKWASKVAHKIMELWESSQQS